MPQAALPGAILSTHMKTIDWVLLAIVALALLKLRSSSSSGELVRVNEWSEIPDVNGEAL